MATHQDYRPDRLGNPKLDEALRIAFDYIYQLRAGQTVITPAARPASPATISAGGVTVVVGGAPAPAPAPVSPVILSGAFEARPATASLNVLYLETSRSGLVSASPAPIYRWDGAGWVLVSGGFTRTQAEVAALSATLGPLDVGATVYVGTPYCHRLLWSGAGWGWADPSDASGRYAYWPLAPGDGWHLVDGAAGINTLLSSGALGGPYTLVDSVGSPFYLRSGTFTGAVVAAAVPTTVAVSAGTPAGTVTQPTFAGDALGTHAHELPLQIASNTVFRTLDQATFGSGTSRAAIGAGVTAPDTTNSAVALSQAVSAGTPSGTVSQPTFAGTVLGTHSHTVSLAGGDPVQHVLCQLYFRL